jgi:hypothetical protein
MAQLGRVFALATSEIIGMQGWGSLEGHLQNAKRWA